ncbi:MAG: hypothetical protein MAG794_00724 [Gammaproteobacteria bacterium]|nr:hypothetical protein [Gammaproteobacteria bacterium]
MAKQAGLPGSKMIPPEQALRSLLALKLIGKARKSHVMNLVFDQGLALFAGLNVIPKRSYLAAYSSRIGEQGIHRFMATWFQQVQRIGLSRTYRTPRVFDERIRLTGYGDKLIRQLSILDLGHEQPTILITNDMRATPATLITRYAQRMLIENGIAEAIQFFHIDALSSMVGLKVDFDLQLTLAASSLYRLFAQRLCDNYHHATARVLFDSLLDVAGKIQIKNTQILVTLDKRAHNPYLVDSGLADHPTPMPWLDNKELVIEFA